LSSLRISVTSSLDGGSSAYAYYLLDGARFSASTVFTIGISRGASALRKRWEERMGFRALPGAVAPVALFAAAFSIATSARAVDESKFPNFSGVWRKPVGIGNQWDQTKPLGRAQEPPFTPEYQAIFEASLADQKAGGQGNDAPSRCVPFAMPRVMTV